MGGLEGIITKLEDYFVEHPKTISFLSGIVATTISSATLYFINDYANDHSGSWFIYSMSAVLGYGAGEKVYNKLNKIKLLKELGLNHKNIKEKLTKKVILSKSNQNVFQKTKDFFFEHPVLTGVFSGSTFFGAAIQFSYLNNHSLNELITTAISKPFESSVLVACEAALSFCCYKATKMNAYFFHSSASEYGKKSLSLALKKFFKSNDYFEKIKSASEKYDYVDFSFLYADECVKRGDVNSAFEILLNVYSKKELLSIPFLWQNDSLNITQSYIAGSYQGIKNNSKSYPDYFFLSLLLKGIDEKQKSLDVMTNFIREADKSDDVRLNANLSYAVFLRKTGENDGFKEQFVKILKLYSDNLKQIGSYKAYLLEENDFSKKTFVIRKSVDEESLNSEKVYTERLKTGFDKVNDEEKFKIIEPPEVVAFNDIYYSATFFEQGKTLFEYLHSKPDISIFNEIARFMGRIHGANEVYESKDNSFYINQLFSRFDETKNSKLSDLKKIIEDNILILFEGFGNFSRVADIDGHRENWIVGKNYTKIDNQARGPTIPFYECSKLLEQGNTIPLNEEGDRIKDNLLKSYYDELSNFQPQVAFEEFLFYKLKSDSIKALSYYFLDHTDLVRQKTAKTFIRNSIHSIDRLLSNYSAELNQTNLKNLKEAETKLLLVEN